MSGGDVSLYLSASSFARIDSLVAFVPNAEGGVVIRVVDDDVWPAIPKAALAPRAAVALDLLESGDARHWIAGEHLADLIG